MFVFMLEALKWWDSMFKLKTDFYFGAKKGSSVEIPLLKVLSMKH